MRPDNAVPPKEENVSLNHLPGASIPVPPVATASDAAAAPLVMPWVPGVPGIPGGTVPTDFPPGLPVGLFPPGAPGTVEFLMPGLIPGMTAFSAGVPSWLPTTSNLPFALEQISQPTAHEDNTELRRTASGQTFRRSASGRMIRESAPDIEDAAAAAAAGAILPIVPARVISISTPEEGPKEWPPPDMILPSISMIYHPDNLSNRPPRVTLLHDGTTLTSFGWEFVSTHKDVPKTPLPEPTFIDSADALRMNMQEDRRPRELRRARSGPARTSEDASPPKPQIPSSPPVTETPTTPPAERSPLPIDLTPDLLKRLPPEVLRMFPPDQLAEALLKPRASGGLKGFNTSGPLKPSLSGVIKPGGSVPLKGFGRASANLQPQQQQQQQRPLAAAPPMSPPPQYPVPVKRLVGRPVLLPQTAPVGKRRPVGQWMGPSQMAYGPSKAMPGGRPRVQQPLQQPLPQPMQQQYMQKQGPARFQPNPWRPRPLPRGIWPPIERRAAMPPSAPYTRKSGT